MKLLAVASAGGHWIELLRLRPFFDEHDTTYVSTNESFGRVLKGVAYHTVPEASRWNKLRLLHSAWRIFRLIRSVRPDAVISTGAAPGVTALFIGKLLGCKTIWIESICNIERISLSGRLAAKFCDRVYTQWPDRAVAPFVYHGNLLT